MKGEEIRIRGLVQGVGFRPTVWQIAKRFNIKGNVVNDGNGVLIKAWGTEDQLDDFCKAILSKPPQLAQIQSLDRTPLVHEAIPSEFVISTSQQTDANTGIVPDAATCPECIAEIFDPDNRRYRYPFTNCTHCGPRLTIIKGIPYDRANTSMTDFILCPECQQEYVDPSDRRFHAQPNACPVCGPKAWLEDIAGNQVSAASLDVIDAIDAASKLIREGKILAIKGIGGFHLACDASNDEAVKRLREKKQRYQKPFALMARNRETIAQYVQLNNDDWKKLSGTQAPIVLMFKKPGASALSALIAPGQKQLGFMLPYSPIHHLLLADWDSPLVMTSGNLVDEPQCTQNEMAQRELGRIADYILMHDRDIINRVDDSVLRQDVKHPSILRRARGFAPSPLSLPATLKHEDCILAMGSELKNTFCLAQHGQAIPSQHLGDLTDVKTADDYKKTLDLYLDIYQKQPHVIAIDKHPGYQASRLGRQLANQDSLPLIEIQHHHAHIASVMADNNYPLDAGPVLGIALDGLGYGEDGALWGGEFLIADYPSYTRVGHIDYCALPGGTAAIKSPWRYAYAQLRTNLGKDWMTGYQDLAFTRWLGSQQLDLLDTMLDKDINSPLTSSCGRLFDAVSAALGICSENISYEGQAAIELENHASDTDQLEPGYDFKIDTNSDILSLQTGRFWQQLLDDLQQGVKTQVIAMRFHKGLATAVLEMAEQLCNKHRLTTIALSGGVFQNQLFTNLLLDMIEETALTPLLHKAVPANDGGLSLGQAAIATALRLK